MKNLSTFEKIAFIWTIPIFIILISAAAVFGTIKFFLILLFVKSGTAGSLSFIFLKVKSSSVKKKFDQFRNEDSIVSSYSNWN